MGQCGHQAHLIEILNMVRSNLIAAMILCAGLFSSSTPADGPPRNAPKRSGVQTPYEQTAQDAYGMGYAFIERATRFDHDAVEASDQRAYREAVRGAAEAYEEALSAFSEAVRLEPGMYEAHTYIGYAHRKLARHDRALAAYDTALRLKPDYARAIEYQAEAYLGLNRFEAAKRNYLRLYALDSEQASKLLVAMQHWVDERRRAPEGLPEGELEAASAWIDSQPRGEMNVRVGEASPW
jgi:tetratricopeptide (TPR) repeat protein